MGLNIERNVMNGIKKVLEANTYIATNTIPVKDFGDSSKERVEKAIYIDAVSAIPEDCQRSPYWIVNVQIFSETYIAEDLNKNTLYAIHQAVMQEICKTAWANYTAQMTSLTVHAIIINSPTQQNMDDKYQQISLEVNFHVEDTS